MPSTRVVVLTSAALLLGVLPVVAAHGEHGMQMDGAPTAVASPPTDDAPPSYFRHPHQGGWMFTHVALLFLGWMLVLPVALMLSVARSRYHLPAQIVFHIFNGLGVFAGFVYNHSTPNLYKGNSHHPLGWIVTAFTVVWTIVSAFVAVGEFKSRRAARASLPMSTSNIAQHNRHQPYVDSPPARYSRDSGQGTEPNSASLMGSRQNSWGSDPQKPEAPEEDHDEELDAVESHGLLGNSSVNRFISSNIHRFATPTASRVVCGIQVVLEKFLLLLGFAAIVSGFVVYGGIFRGKEIFAGMAHLVKGAIFFWYGLLTLGRWMGAFSEFGWAWNVRPQQPLVARWKTRIPSAEFTEAFVIWLYGASNVFMEHMNRWGKEWTAMDFEHVSITILFFGGGLLGMLIESKWVREALNTNVVVQEKEQQEMGEVERSFHFGGAADASGASSADQHPLWSKPSTYKTSLNPMPALVIMLLGMMMSSHHQDSMVSTMMHSQWGMLFSGYAMARAVTYFVLYIKPPSSPYPSRPPSELVAAFCLTAGGLMFMASARDEVHAIEANGLDAMTIFTVTLGLSAMILSWEVVVFSIKGWAVRKERAAVGRPVKGTI